MLEENKNLFTNPGTIFINRTAFSKAYIPKNILHREAEIHSVVNCLKYILNGQQPADCIIYGRSGTGKSLIARYVTGELVKQASVKVYHISLKNTKSEFRAMEKIIETLRNEKIIGQSFNSAVSMLYDHIKKQDEKYIILILDEINDVDYPDVLLHSLLRSNEIYGDLNGKELNFIFISNDLNFPQNLSPGTKSSFTGVTKRMFEAYDANQLRDILRERAAEGLKPGVFDETTISLCAAYGAQELGDARETIKLLEKSAEVADDTGDIKITEKHIQEARQQIEYEGTVKALKTLPQQLKAFVLACVRDQRHHRHEPEYICYTGAAYKEYKEICLKLGLDILTTRRIADFINELENIGIIEAHLKYKQQQGRTRYISPTIPGERLEETILEDPRFESLRPELVQTKLG